MFALVFNTPADGILSMLRGVDDLRQHQLGECQQKVNKLKMTASFFYDSRDSGRDMKMSAPSQYVLAKTETDHELSKLVTIKQEEDDTLPPQRVPSKEYLAAKRQYEQNLLMRQQYLMSQAALSEDQKQYLIRRGVVTPSQTADKLSHPGHSLPNRSYDRPSAYPQHVTTSNVQYSMVMPPQAAPTMASGVQRVPPHMIIQPQYPARVQPTHSHGVQRISIRPGVQYANVPMMHYMPYQGDFETPTYISHQGQVHHVPPQSAFVYAQEEGPVTVQHIPYGYAQVPMNYAQGPALVFDSNANLQPTFIREETNTGRESLGTVSGGKKARLKRMRVPEGEEENDTGTKRTRSSKRKKTDNVAEGNANQHDDVNIDGPALPLTHGELLKQKKRNMAFPKGTFLVRYADLDSDQYAGHIWLVDNHQLLQKYTYDGLDASNVKVFSRTERYSGWLCTCPWLYHPLSDVKSILGNMEKVSITNYPTRDELFARREEEKLKAPEPEPMEEHQETVPSDGDHSGDEHDIDVNDKEEVDDLPLFKTEPIEISAEN
ncbi:hypothetical protein RB195_005391 [Necator americanus]|uniref:SH2 domain-containing protein n=1 Tax=Necator americanus TaxID=51031 RepID=A0ABR1BML2_NECAM